MQDQPTIIFVYNANSGKWNLYMDILHKIVSPKTYPCSLCAITHGVFSIHEEWAEFKKDYPIPMRFLHKDEWEQEFDRKDELPAVFLQQNGEISTWIDAKTMDEYTLQDLKDQMMVRLPELGMVV